MARLSYKRRKKLPKSAFALPGRRAYPITDKAHARNAKARASAQYRRGKLSRSSYNRINARANKVLGGRRRRR